MITVTTPCQDIKPNTFMMEGALTIPQISRFYYRMLFLTKIWYVCYKNGHKLILIVYMLVPFSVFTHMHVSDSMMDVSLLGKLINPIVASCLDKSEFHDWIRYFKNADVPILSPPPPVYDIIYTPTQKQVSEPYWRCCGGPRTKIFTLTSFIPQAPEFDRWSGTSREASEPQRQSQDKRRSRELQLPVGDDNLVSPGYTEPLCVSACSNSPNPLMSSCQHDICLTATCYYKETHFSWRFNAGHFDLLLCRHLVWYLVRRWLSAGFKYVKSPHYS